ncbi:MAG TPA: DUF2267 domain-containing protein [Ignavibacteriales bacterium]|nr:DUF2267 domain-containing protein [Ignavibacteriales bacterium]
MDYASFHKEVAKKALLTNPEETDTAIKAALRTLSELLASNETAHLGPMLPSEISKYLIVPSKGQVFSVDEFFQHVAHIERVPLNHAMHHARTVIEVLCKMLSEEEINLIRSQLSPDFAVLFETSGSAAYERKN